MINKVAVFLSSLILTIIGVLMWSAFHYHSKAITAEGKVSQLQTDNTLQAGTIAAQAFSFEAFNQLSADNEQYEAKVTGNSEENVIEYRTILKKVPVCSQLVPASISERLLDYTHRLRTGAMPGTVSNADSTGDGPASASELTYCQAVLWIDPLLTAIDKANSQLSGIRQEDAQRTGKAVTPPN